MLPMGGSKGAMLALVVELLACALMGAAFGFEADSFFVDEGNRPRLGQAFLVLDSHALAGRGVYLERVETLVTIMMEESGVRLPGNHRDALAATAARNGIEIAPGPSDELARLAVAWGASAQVFTIALFGRMRMDARRVTQVVVDPTIPRSTAKQTPHWAAARRDGAFRAVCLVW
jgi:hypothetical protein